MGINFKSSNNVLFDTKFLQMKKAKSPDGSHDWMYAHRPNAKDVVVIAPIIDKNGDKKITKDDSILFIETERPPIKAEGKAERCIELPAGLVGDENPTEGIKDAVKKELAEETGFEADIEIVGRNIASSPGCVSETSTFAIANIFANNPKVVQDPVDDGGVIKARHQVPIKELDSWLQKQQESGKAISAQALSGLYFVNSRMNNNQ